MFDIVFGSSYKGVATPGPSVAAQVVEVENLLKVRLIILGHVCRKVVENMLDGGDWSPDYEGSWMTTLSSDPLSFKGRRPSCSMKPSLLNLFRK